MSSLTTKTGAGGSRVLLMLAAVATLVLSACGAAPATTPNPAATGKPILVGVLDDTSGAAAPYSSLTDRGVHAAVDDINSKGGVNGRPIELTFESDGNVPANSPALVQKMIQAGAKFIIMTSGSASSLAIKKTLAAAQVPGFASTNQNTGIGAPPDNEYTFMQSNTSTDIANIYAAGWVKAGYKTLGVMSDDSPTTSNGNKLMFPIWQAAGINIVATEKAPNDATDVTAQISRIKAKNPDAVIMTSLGGQLEVLVQNTLATQMKGVPRFSLASIGNQPSNWALAQPNGLDGLVYAAQVDPTNPRATALTSLMTKKYGKDFTFLTAYEAQAWDSIQIMKLAMEKGGNPDDPTKNKAGMEEISKFQTASGGKTFTVSFSPTKHSGQDGLCGISLVAFKGNKPGGPWPVYQPTCTTP
jgi:branched-chain amino acid transport system substrate-binding protein